MTTAAVLTISDSSFQQQRPDLSGPLVAKQLESAGFSIAIARILPDDRPQIEKALVESCRTARLVVTVGGTGLAPRDVTPEATRAVIERAIDGLSEKMRAEGLKKTQFATLSRGICGSRGTTLIVNLPGSPTAALESLLAVVGILPHALELLAGKTEHPQTKNPA